METIYYTVTILYWLAVRDLNPEPASYAYHYSFHCLFQVCGLDSLFPLRACRRVSTPSCLQAWLGISISRKRDLAFPEFDKFY